MLQTAVSPSDIACIHCGGGNRYGAQFCLHCGQSQAQSNKKRYETGKLPSNAAMQGSDGSEYLTIELIAQGGMGAVYKVVRPRDKTTWAIKEMSESAIAFGEKKQTIDAFYEEARLLETLEHDNLPDVIDAFENNGRHYMVMDFVGGHTFTHLMEQKGGILPEDDVVEWGAQLCVVLDYLHNHNPPIIYRDLKPDNVMIETATDAIKLIDFGIARRYKSGKKGDTTNLGTSGYAAPEQYAKAGQQSDARTDIYALGATMHHMLTGQDPADSPFNFAAVEDHNTAVSEPICNAIAKAVKPKENHRHQSATEMYEALTGEEMPAQNTPKVKKSVSKSIATPTTSSSSPLPISLVPVLSEQTMQFDGMEQGDSDTKYLPVSISTGELAVTTDVDWLDVYPSEADSSTTDIEMTAETALLTTGRERRDVTYTPSWTVDYILVWLLWLLYAHAYYFVPVEETYQGQVKIGSEEVEVLVTISPVEMRVYAGWVASAAAVAGELGAAGGLIWLLFLGL